MSRGRGRGRSGRGRGGRGRGGRGGRGGRRQYRSRTRSVEDKQGAIVPVDLDVDKDVLAYFTGNVTVQQHIDGQNKNKERYAAGMVVLMESGAEVIQNVRIRALTAAWARKDYALADAFLEDKKNFGLVEVLKSLQLLDSARQVRILEKKYKQLQLSKNKVLPKTLGKLKSDIDNLSKLKTPQGSASGALCKHIRQWVKNFTTKELEFFALHFPKESWKKLADICHFHPEKDFPNLPWFLPFCFGKDAPDSHMVAKCKTLSADNINELLLEFNLPYTKVREFKSNLTSESKGLIASREPKLDTVLWWYEELMCKETDEAISRRLENGEKVQLPNGKLLERLLVFKMLRKKNKENAPFLDHILPIAEKNMKEIRLSLESPILVIGDASSSMDVAIRTSTIIAGILTTITSAKLSFFNNKSWVPDKIPSTVEEVLELAVSTKASGCTANAASLYPFYENKEVVKTIIMVTDEQENTDFQKFRFRGLYEKYCQEVFPAKLVFVSFLGGQHAKGHMVSDFKKNGMDPMQFVFHSRQPDLTKLDKLFGLLSAETVTFQDEVTVKEQEIKTKGLLKVFQGLAFDDKNE